MIRDGYVVEWRGRQYEARPGADGTVRIYSGDPVDGFEELRPGRHRRIVPASETEGLAYVRTICTWRGERFIVVGEYDTWIRVEYVGGRAPVAERLELDRIDHGVWQTWAPRDEVTDMHEEMT